MGRVAPVHLKSFIAALFLLTVLRVGDIAAQLGKLNTKGLIGPGGITESPEVRRS